MKLLRRRSKTKDLQTQAIKSELPTDETLAEELDELSAIGGKRDISAADVQVKEAVTKATRDDIRSIKLIEQGRCPDCQGRTENFLYTVICPSCGWFRRSVPEGGKSVVYLNNGNKIQCDHVYRGGADEYLCVKDGVVVSEVMRSSVRRVDHLWDAKELEVARERVRFIGLSVLYAPPRRGRVLEPVVWCSSHHSHVLPSMSRTPSGVAPSGKASTGLVSVSGLLQAPGLILSPQG